MSVVPTSLVVEAGLGGRFDDVLIAQAYAAGAWSLSQLQATTSRDLTGNGHTATYSGSGFTRGVTVADQPEGAQGCTLNGSGYLAIADDSTAPTGPELSLPGGSMDVVADFSTSTSDATLRALVQKQVTDSSGNGYHMAIQSGAVRFFLRVSGSTIFDFARGSIADGARHVVHGYYDPNSGEARIFIDGVQSGATVTGVTTEPLTTTAPMRIGMFNDGSGGFIGTINKIMVGREGNLSLASSLQATRSWTDITSDVRTSVQPIVAQYGIPGAGVQDTVAQSGQLTFALDNSTGNSAGLNGYYAVGHANCRSGFKVGAAVRLRIAYGGTTYYKFRGTIASAPTRPDPKGDRYTSVTCFDYLSTLNRTNSGTLPVQASQLASTVFGVIVDAARRPPPAVSVNASVLTIPYALDSSGTRDKLITEAARLGARGDLIYQRGDTTQGGTLVFEPRELRQAGASIAGTFTELTDLDVDYAESRIVNVVYVTYYPRRLDASSTQTLAQLPVDVSPQAVMPGDTVVLRADYKDPAAKSQQIGGTSMTSVATTDWTMNSASNGSGTNLTSSFAVSVQFFANAVEWTIKNNATSLGYITLLKARGQAIYYDDPVTVAVRDEDSVNEHDECELNVDLPYEGSQSGALEYGRLVLAAYATLPANIPRSARVIGNRSSSLLTHVLAREIGDVIAVSAPQAGISSSLGWYIQSVTLTASMIRGGAMVDVAWGLAPSWPESLVVAYSGASSGLHNLTFGGTLEVSVPGDYTFVFNRTGDDVLVKGVAGGGGGGHGNADSGSNPGGGGGGGGAQNVTGVTVTLGTTTYGVKVGAGGPGGRPGTTGGTTEFRVPAGAVSLQLSGGTGGDDGVGDTGGSAGTGGSAAVGAGGVAGTNGGVGGNTGSPGTAGTNNATGAAGGGGGGSAGQDGRAGGNGKDQAGGTAVSAGNAGVDASGLGGSLGVGSPGGSGSGGGGVVLGGLGYRGGGGGGGAGATSSNGEGGSGGNGAITFELVA